MKLYHGSYVEVKQPQILTPNRALDFGAGFYTTSSFEQAKAWAKRQMKMRTITGILDVYDQALVTSYLFDEENAQKNLRMLIFQTPDSDWLDFV